MPPADAPFAGTYRPEGSLAAFDSRNSLGTWTLEVGDDKKGGKKGTLNQWSITIVYEQASAGSSGQARAAKASSALAQSAAPALPAVLVDRLFAAAARELVPSRASRIPAQAAEEIADTRRERDDRSYLDLFGNSSHGLSTKDRSVGTSSSDGDGSTVNYQSSTEAIDVALEDLLSAGTRKRGR